LTLIDAAGVRQIEELRVSTSLGKDFHHGFLDAAIVPPERYLQVKVVVIGILSSPNTRASKQVARTAGFAVRGSSLATIIRWRGMTSGMEETRTAKSAVRATGFKN
jgi:hypothetical protein